jgi:hypothetical protein
MEKITHKETLVKKSIRLLKGALAASIITGSVYADEKQDTENQEGWVKLEQKMNQNESNWLAEFKIDSIKVGKVKEHSRGIHRQVGIYKDGNHLGDIRSDVIEFSKDDFIRDVANLLDENNIEYKLDQSTDQMIEIELEDNAMKKMTELKTKGLRCGKTKNKKGDDVLVIQGNKGADFFSLEIDLKNDHNPNTYVKIDVNEQGHLRIEGKDDKPFRYEIFTEDGSGEIKILNQSIDK